jgi:hypothetical protein
MSEQRLENSKLIKDSQVKGNLNYLIQDMEDIFTENRMKHGLIFGFFKDCVNGQILVSLNQKPDHYVNELSDFYIDDRVGFRGIKRVRAIIKTIESELMKIVKRQTPKIIIGDIVRPLHDTRNVTLKERLEKNPDLKLQIVSMEKGLNPNYIKYRAVNSDEKPFKKNWIYVGSNDVVKETTN